MYGEYKLFTLFVVLRQLVACGKGSSADGQAYSGIHADRPLYMAGALTPYSLWTAADCFPGCEWDIPGTEG